MNVNSVQYYPRTRWIKKLGNMNFPPPLIWHILSYVSDCPYSAALTCRAWTHAALERGHVCLNQLMIVASMDPTGVHIMKYVHSLDVEWSADVVWMRTYTPSLDAVKWLVDVGHINLRTNHLVVLSAVAQDCPAYVQYVNTHVEFTQDEFDTMAMVACEWDSFKVLKTLMQVGANVHAEHGKAASYRIRRPVCGITGG